MLGYIKKYFPNILKRHAKKMTGSCLRSTGLVLQSPVTVTMASIIPGNSPELWWILFYEPVHIKAVVKLDGRKKKEVSHR